jgi:restriction system protein
VLQAAERERLRQDKSRAKEYAEARVAEALEQTNDVGAQVEEISGLLGVFLRLSGRLDLQSLKTPPPNPPFDPGPLGVANPPPSESEYLPKELGFVQRAVPGAHARHAQAVLEAKSKYAAAVADWQSQDAQRVASLGQRRSSHQSALDTAVRENTAHNSEVDSLIQGFRAHKTDRDHYVVKVRVASSSLVSRLDTPVPRLG